MTPEPAFSQPVADLLCHPDTPCPHVQRIRVTAQRLDPTRLLLGFALQGDLDRLLIPPPGPRERRDRLWQHTCFEAFLRIDGADAYHELNFSPCSAWAAYAFEGYRRGGSRLPGWDPCTTLHREGADLELAVQVRLDHLLQVPGPHRLSLGMSTVVEAADGTLSYWALRHAPGQPDFHTPLAFALELPPMPHEG